VIVRRGEGDGGGGGGRDGAAGGGRGGGAAARRRRRGGSPGANSGGGETPPRGRGRCPPRGGRGAGGDEGAPHSYMQRNLRWQRMVVAQRPRLHPSRDGCRAFRDRSSPRGATPLRGDDRGPAWTWPAGTAAADAEAGGGSAEPPPPARAHPGRRFSGVIFGGVMAERS
jgi:hypothetical protein